MTAIWWIRRDLRLTDNPTLHAALETFDQTQDKAGEVVPDFYIEEREKLVMDRQCPRHQGKPTRKPATDVPGGSGSTRVGMPKVCQTR
jgi:hypothetical protein